MAIPLIGPDGRKYEIEDPAQVSEAVKLGYRVETLEAPHSLGEQAEGLARDASDVLETGVEGAAQGVTAGGYGALLGRKQNAAESPGAYALRRGEVADFNARKEENPVAHGIGEFAGMVASPINKIGAGIRGALGATTAIGRIGASAVAGGAEGILYGAGNTMSDAALGDTDLTGEKLAAGIGLGGLLGFGGAGVGAGLAEGFKAVLPAAGRMLGKAAPELGDWANNRALKAAGATKKDLDYLGADRAKEVGTMLLERGHLGQGMEAPNAAGVLKSISAEKETMGAQLGKVFDDAHAAGAQPAYSNVLKRLDDFEAGLSPLERKAVAGEVKEARDAVLEYGGKPVTDPKSGFKALNELKQDLQKKAKWGDNVGQEFKGTLKRQLSGVVRDELDQQLVQTLGSDAGKAFTDTNRLYGLLSDAERVAEHGAERLGGNASFGLRDLGLGAAAGLGHGDPVSGVVAAVASKVMRERGQAVIARLADQIAKSPQLQLTATSFGKQLQAAAPELGTYAAPLMQAYSHSPAQALATHMVQAHVDPRYAAAAQSAGFLPETPEEAHHAAAKSNTLAAVASTLDTQNQEITRHLDAVLKGEKKPKAPDVHSTQDFGAKRMRAKDSLSAHSRRVDEIRQLAANPDALLERVAGNMGDVSEMAPGVAAAMTRTAHAAVQYLAQAAATPLKPGPMAPEWRPSEAEQHTFSQKLEAVQEPLSVLRHAAAGTLVPDQWTAVQTVYPLLARQIQDMATERMVSEKSVPYRARMMLHLITGVDPDGSMGAAVALNQAAIASAGAKQPSMGASDSKQSKLTLGERSATPGQKREMEISE